MTQTPIKKLVNTIAIPAALSLAATSLYQVFDMYFVSGLGDQATAAVGVAFAIVVVIQAVGFTIGMGVGTEVAACLGQKNDKTAEEIATSALQFGMLWGIVIAAAGVLWTEPILKFSGGTASSISGGIWYARLISLNAPFLIGTFVLNNLLRAEGKTSVAMLVVLSGGLIGIILDPVFIYLLGLGVTGAGVAAVVSQVYSFALLLLLYLRRKTKLHISLIGSIKKWKHIGGILQNGMSGLFRQGLACAAVVCINRNAAEYGDEAVAAMSVSGKIYMVIFTLVIGMGQALQTITGYHYRTGKEERIREAFYNCLYKGIVGMTVATGILYVLSWDLMSLFAKGRKETIEMGTTALRYQALVFPFMVLPVLCNMIYQGEKKYVKSTWITSLRQGVFFLPTLYLFAHLWEMQGVMLAQPAADICTCLVTVPLLVRNHAMIFPASANPADKHNNSP